MNLFEVFNLKKKRNLTNMKKIMNVSWVWDIRFAIFDLWVTQIRKPKDSREHLSYLKTKKNRDDGYNYVVWFNDYWWMLEFVKEMMKTKSAPYSAITWIEDEQENVYKMFDNGHTNICLKLDLRKKEVQPEDNYEQYHD